EILTIILPVLEYIHGQRIVHRDIKPDNIIIRYSDKQPVLIDFGAVKETIHTVMANSENSTRSIVIGTPGFMPSEQTAGRPVYSSELYSLGLTAVYLLPGKMPQEIENNPATGEIMWREYAPNITSSFAAVLDKAIQFHPRERFATAREMLSAIQDEMATIAPKVAQTPLAARATSVQTPTLISAPSEIQAQPPTPPTIAVNPGMKDWQKATIIGSIIGVCVIGGIAIIGRESNTTVTIARKPVKNNDNSVKNNQVLGNSLNKNSFSQTASLITRDAAISILNKWQEAKREVFAPPFNRSLGAELTTGEAYRKNIGSGSSLEWLENNSSYYRYGVQKIEDINNFVASNDRATIEIVFTEDRKFYRNGKIVIGKNTSFDTRLVRYSLKLEDNKLKISDYETVRVLSIR
ncbi:MAG: IMS domain-containing protein, partial [Rivularia sp. ALOHA_DT_140]|nr:IMS domain-containing protein [Rivularia sp. ALOHA_DT_140]